jgi:hypothetical protein
MLSLSFNNILFIDNILVILKMDKEIIFNNNFYELDFFYDFYICFHILPEILLILFILYNLISFFDDIYKPIFQLYRWFFLYFIILINFILKFMYFS